MVFFFVVYFCDGVGIDDILMDCYGWSLLGMLLIILFFRFEFWGCDVFFVDLMCW